MITLKRMTFLLTAAFVMLSLPAVGFAEEGGEDSDDKDDFSIPEHVLNISKENTYPNSGEDQAVVEPSDFTKSLFEDIDIRIDNPELIKVLNESKINPSPIGFGYRGTVYIGRWPLNYESSDTSVNWEYQHVNTNELNNIGGDASEEMTYTQVEQKEIQGALTNEISEPENIKKMMLTNAADTTELPLSYNTIIGKNTQKENTYNVPVKKSGELKAYTPALNEKGQVTFGEVYFKLKGTKKSLVIKNVTQQNIGAWIPIEDHLSFSFNQE